MSSTLPLFPTDDGWPYPDAVEIDVADAAVDFDALEMLGPHSFDALTPVERDVLFWHFGLDGRNALSMKELTAYLGCSRSDARLVLGTAIDKVRVQLSQD